MPSYKGNKSEHHCKILRKFRRIFQILRHKKIFLQIAISMFFGVYLTVYLPGVSGVECRFWMLNLHPKNIQLKNTFLYAPKLDKNQLW